MIQPASRQLTGPAPELDPPAPPSDDEQLNPFLGALVSLAYLREALRRRRRVWTAAAVIGLVLGAAYHFVIPMPSHATTTLLLTHRDGEDPDRAVATDVSLAHSRSVAERAANGLHLSPDALLAQYRVTPLTSRVVQFAVSAPTPDEAVRRAGALAQAFLQFRRDLLQTDRQQLLTTSSQRAAELRDQISTLEQSGAGQHTAQLDDLRAELAGLPDAGRQLDAQTSAEIANSGVLDGAVALAQPHRKLLLLNSASGLVAGLVLAVTFVILQASLSDKLRRRSDIAVLLQAPVVVSLHGMLAPDRSIARVSRRLRGRSGQASEELQRAVDCLAGYLALKTPLLPADVGRVPPPSAAMALALISVESDAACARLAMELAARCTARNQQVLVVDLTHSSALAGSLGLVKPATVPVPIAGSTVPVTVCVPASPTLTAQGLATGLPDNGPPSGAQAVPDVRAADVVLAVASVEPTHGSDHLTTWSNHAVAVVTAGRSSGARVQAAAELVRLAGLQLDAAVLLGADRTDQSVGVPAPWAAQTGRQGAARAAT